MEKSNMSLFFLVCLLSCTFALATRPTYFEQKEAIQAAADWCTAQPGAPDDKLQAFIDYACGVADCAGIQPGAPCFDPDTVQSHASYALNAVYRQLGSCSSDVGLITTSDPSNGGCQYP